MEGLDNIFDNWLKDLLINVGISGKISMYLSITINVIVLLIICYVVYWVSKRILLKIVITFIKRTKSNWDNILLKEKVFNSIAHIAPILVLRYFIPFIFDDYPEIIPILIKATDIYFIIIIIKTVNSFFNSVEQVLRKSPALKDKPMHSYFQLVKIIMYLLGIILVVSLLINKSPIYLISAFGAMSAILLLVFKDTILGFVASIQISVNDMVRVGDWITMKKHGADGDVLKITLNTVKVQNFDKTIVTVPTYAFISESFQNWRGMSKSGGRRIKRALSVRISNIKFCTKEMLNNYRKIEYIKDYIEEKEKEIGDYNTKQKIDKVELLNGRNLTNIGLFRKYIEVYLEKNEDLKKDFTLMVRQLPPTETGLPLEIYTFTKTTDWLQYEDIQSDIFDHILASAKEFDLKVFEYSSNVNVVKQS
jgi:miniconductance mechanosensitive channel